MSVTPKATKGPTTHHIFLHWFRHGDLRLHDNPALVHTCKMAAAAAASASTSTKTSASTTTYLVPFFCFSNQIFGNSVRTPFDHLKCGPRRARFVQESVQDLQRRLQSVGSGLAVAYGREPHQFVEQVVQQVALSGARVEYTVVVQEEVLQEELDAVRAMRQVLQQQVGGSQKARVTSIWGSTMYELSDLPFEEHLSNLPNSFTPFRNKVEKACHIGRHMAPPTKTKMAPYFPPVGTDDGSNNDLGSALHRIVAQHQTIPTLVDLGYTAAQVEEANMNDPRGVLPFRGGETAALARVKEYIWTEDCLKSYFDTRNGMLGPNYSTKFSPWLAHGCLSPRLVAHECRRYEEERGIQNKSTYWVVFELLWRDYCKFFCTKHGNRVFFPSGTDGRSNVQWQNYPPTLQAWMEGQTGYPLVDANMRELRATGFMSNRGRQNVCSFLAIDLQQDWRVGGYHFEEHLLDYDVYSNWYNWCAGAGQTGGRLNRFNIVKQSKDYDQHGEYVRHWCPELKNVPTQFVHEPWKMNQFQQKECGVTLGVDYPHPIVKPSTPSHPNSDNAGGRGGRKGGKNRGDGGRVKQRKPNPGSKENRHQKYEMKSLKEGRISIK